MCWSSARHNPRWPAAKVGSSSSFEGERQMALYEMRTYTLYVGKMAEATKLYQEFGFPALQRAGMTRS
jgi:hypothetical protein